MQKRIESKPDVMIFETMVLSSTVLPVWWHSLIDGELGAAALMAAAMAASTSAMFPGYDARQLISHGIYGN